MELSLIGNLVSAIGALISLVFSLKLNHKVKCRFTKRLIPAFAYALALRVLVLIDYARGDTNFEWTTWAMGIFWILLTYAFVDLWTLIKKIY